MSTRRWIFSPEALASPPSVQPPRGGGMAISLAEERKCRLEAVGHLQQVAKVLDIPKSPALVIAVASTLLHRFYMFQTFREFRRLHLATACLFLAMKTSKIFEVSRLSHNLTIIQVAAKSFKQAKLQVKEDSADFAHYIDEVLYCERALLATVNFDLDVVTPHELVMGYLPEIIAVACMVHATERLTKKNPKHPFVINPAPNGEPWYNVATVTLTGREKPTEEQIGTVVNEIKSFIEEEEALLQAEHANTQRKPRPANSDSRH